MTGRKMIILMAVFAIAGPVMALTESQTLPFQFSLSPNGQTLNFSQFDTMGGTRILTAVTLDLNATERANGTCENDDLNLGGSMSMGLTGFVTGNGGGMGTSALLSFTSPTVGVTASDGVAGSGSDYHDFGLLTDSGSDNDFLILGFPGHDLSPFIGSGLIGIDIAGEGGFSFQGVSSATMVVTNFEALGDAMITYTYTPEPATMVLLGLGGLLLRKRISS